MTIRILEKPTKETLDNIKIFQIKEVRKMLKRDFGFCTKEINLDCRACQARLVDAFLREWADDIDYKDELKKK